MLHYNLRRMQDAVRTARLLSLAAFMFAMAVAAPSTIDAAVPAEQTAASPRSAPAQKPFVVRVLPPLPAPSARSPLSLPSLLGSAAPPAPAGGADAAAKARLEKYYVALIGKLRAVPGLVLVTDGPAGTMDLSAVEYEIAVTLTPDWHGVEIDAKKLPETQFPSRVTWRTIESLLDGTLFAAALAPRLAALSSPTPPDDPDREMESLVERMRLTLFPKDRALLDKKMSDLRDPQLQPNQRVIALSHLMSADSRRDAFGGALPPPTYRPDPALVNAVTEVAMTAADPALRLQLWSRFSGIGIPRVDPLVLVAPAERALARESDVRVQLLLVNILGMSLANPRARAALDAVAHSEADSDRPDLVRMAARRMLNGGEGWSEYVVSMLRDPTVPDAELVELIRYVSSLPSSVAVVTLESRRALLPDEATQRAVASLLKKQGSVEVVAAAAGLLLSQGGAVAVEALVEFLRTGTGQPVADKDNSLRRSVLSSLARELRSRPEVRAAFEEVAARDRDPVMREAAQQGLDQTR